jgi:hypothetical protein
MATYSCKICGRQYDSWTSKAAHGFCSEWCERSPFLPFPELDEPTRKQPSSLCNPAGNEMTAAS